MRRDGWRVVILTGVVTLSLVLRGDVGGELFLFGVRPDDELTHLVLRLRVSVTAPDSVNARGIERPWSD